MKQIIKNINLPFLVISIVLAFFVWNIIMNIINPLVVQKNVVNISMVLSDAARDNNKTYTLDRANTSVVVSYSIRKDDQAKIGSRDMSCVVNVDDTVISERLPIEISFRNNVDQYIKNLNLEPSKVLVSSDDYATKSFRIDTIQSGELMSTDLMVGYVSVEPSEVSLSGSISEINKVDRVCIDVDISGKSNSFEGARTLVFYDRDGEVIDDLDVEKSQSVATYKVVVYGTKGLNINATISGNVARGYSYAGTMVTPTSITVSGPRDVIATLTTIDLPVIDITGATENREVYMNVADIIPRNTRNASNTAFVKVVVTVNEMNSSHSEDEAEEGETVFEPVAHPPVVEGYEYQSKLSTGSNVIITRRVPVE